MSVVGECDSVSRRGSVLFSGRELWIFVQSSTFFSKRTRILFVFDDLSLIVLSSNVLLFQSLEIFLNVRAGTMVTARAFLFFSFFCTDVHNTEGRLKKCL